MADLRSQNSSIKDDINDSDSDVDAEYADAATESLDVVCRALPLQCLGKGFTSVDAKLDALLHSFLLEVGPDGLECYNKQVICNVSDQGVEFKLATAPRIDVKELIQESEQALTSMFGKNQGLALENEPGFSLQLALPGQETVAVSKDITPTAPDEECDGDAGTMPADRTAKLYPNSFQTADMKHIVDNILGEILDLMKSL